jgi:hypothetical protein
LAAAPPDWNARLPDTVIVPGVPTAAQVAFDLDPM